MSLSEPVVAALLTASAALIGAIVLRLNSRSATDRADRDLFADVHIQYFAALGEVVQETGRFIEVDISSSARTATLWNEIEVGVSDAWRAALAPIYRFMVYGSPEVSPVGEQMRCFVELRIRNFYECQDPERQRWSRETANANGQIWGELVAEMALRIAFSAPANQRRLKRQKQPALADRSFVVIDIAQNEAWPAA